MPSRRICTSTARVTAGLLLSFLALSPYAISSVAAVQAAAHPANAVLPPIQVPFPDGSQDDTAGVERLDFSLRHIFHHGAYKYPELHRRLDVPKDAQVWIVSDDDPSIKEPVPPLQALSSTARIQRLVDRSAEHINSILEYKRMTGYTLDLPESAWVTEDVRGPNVTDKASVLTFARIAANAYVTGPGLGDWRDVKGGFNYTEDFGWESDGLRGHIFADTKNSTVVIGLKGTSPAVFDGSETTTNDKVNDNLYFSCCCGQGGNYLWRQVCDCMTSSYTCNSTCLVTALRDKYRYYSAVQDLYHNVTELYPEADVWVSGHSLGGAMSSLLSLTYGLPAITFEAVPDALPAARLGLPVPPGHQIGGLHQRRPFTGAYHFGHTADPVYMGTCNAATSSCTLGGYAMQSQCHTGHKCVYDTVGDLGWRVGIGTHRIQEVIRDVLEKYEDVPKCEQYVNCTDCYPWNYYESNGTETTTTSSSTATSTSSTRTRTETCKTPGWWGCLDETTTSGPTSSTSTTSTSTCKTPGWFGCKDKTTTTTTTSTSSSSAPASVPATTTAAMPTSSTTAASSTSCKHPGWFGGCKDSTSTPTPTRTASSAPSLTHSCTEKRWFGFVCVDPSTDVAAPAATTSVPADDPRDVRGHRWKWMGDL